MSGKTELSPEKIAEIAHELRSPLGGIEAMVSLLDASPLDAEQTRIVAALRVSIAHLRGIANTVLGAPSMVADGEPREQPAPGKPRDLGGFLVAFETACRARASARRLDFVLAADGLVRASLIFDIGGLRQVLENLIDNAFRLTSAGRIELRIARKTEGRLAFRVSDSGPGLSAADAARLIREGGGVDGRAGGAGLGLSIAGRIVARHGGALSGGPGAEGVGTVFTFDWPSYGAASIGECLIVDDHPASRLVLRTILEAAGHTCIEAAGIEDAFALIKSRSPGLVLTDLNMPNGGGRALIEKITGLPEVQRPSLVVVSAEELDHGHPVHRLIDGAIRKPITVRGVLETVAALRRRDEVCAA